MNSILSSHIRPSALLIAFFTASLLFRDSRDSLNNKLNGYKHFRSLCPLASMSTICPRKIVLKSMVSPWYLTDFDHETDVPSIVSSALKGGQEIFYSDSDAEISSYLFYQY